MIWPLGLGVGFVGFVGVVVGLISCYYLAAIVF